MSRANYSIEVDDSLDTPLVIRDVGPWDKHMTVTNDVEAVVEELVKKGRLPPRRKLLYYDSEGDLSKILVMDGHFTGFSPSREGMPEDRRSASD